jgi:hypothetical protein
LQLSLRALRFRYKAAKVPRALALDHGLHVKKTCLITSCFDGLIGPPLPRLQKIDII